ncbi:MAG: hypothetical protein LQ338_007679 [Usnochroma carphineum]|nr:MAG: hypothetical protein LQ338_007679 [Usnochroma carphineum]
MSNTEGTTHLVKVAQRVQDALNDDSHEFWDRFGKSWESDDVTMEGLQAEIQAVDDEERKSKNLPPRPWSEIEKEMEEESDKTLESFDDDLMAWDTEEREKKGLGPRSKEEMEEELMPKITEVVYEVLYKCDTKKRKEKGLGPRDVKEFQKVLQEGGMKGLDG